MSYTIDKDLKAGMELVAGGEKIDKGLKLINKSARTGTTKGKSYFEVATIIHDGCPGLEANADEARRYYDAAMKHFDKDNADSLDNREMGDYYNYALGTEPADKMKALEYYDKAAVDGDEVAKERADEIRASMEKGTSEQAPALTPETQAATAPVEEKKPAETVVAAPVVTSQNQVATVTDKVIGEEIDKDQILIKVIHILDSVSASEQDKKDAVELAKAASDDGSVRAAVLVGYLYEGDNNLVGRDFDKAKEYYEKAIKEGSASALFRLGILYTDEETSYYNADKGHDLILQSAHKGYSWALAYLGDCFRVKVNDPHNLELAYRYYALAGERGLGLAYHNMAEIDASRQQLDLAKKHEKLAMDNGYDPQIGHQDPLFYSLHI